MRGRYFLTGVMAAALVAIAGQASAVDPGLIERAKKEGKVSYYSTRQISTMRAMAAAFKAKYGIELEYSRHSNEDLVRKIVSEFNANRPTADVFDGSTSFASLLEAGVVDTYKPEEAAGFDPGFKDPDGYWTAMNVYIAGLAYNTDLVKPADVPTKIDDILDPKWSGRKIVFGAQYNPSGIIGLLGGLEKERGADAAREFGRKLRALNPIALDASPAGAADALASGQAAICIGCLNQHIQRAIDKGAPVKWMNNIQPIVAFFSHVGIVKNQSRPNAARLFVEWTMSEEAQQLAEKEFYIGSRPGLEGPYKNLRPSTGGFTVMSVTPKMILEDMPRWSKLHDEVMR